MTRQLPLDPRHEEIDDTLLPLGGDGDPARHLPPLCEAVATTTGTGVLRFENRMTAHWSLLAVVRRIRGRELGTYEVFTMASDFVHAFFGNVLPIRLRESEARSELRLS